VQLLYLQIQKAQNIQLVFFVLLGSSRIKAVCKMLVKSTPGVNFIHILRQRFFANILVPKNFKAERNEKLVCKMLMKSTPGVVQYISIFNISQEM